MFGKDSMPEIVRIGLSDRCNLDCPQCRHNSTYHPDRGKNNVDMTEEQIFGIIDEIAPSKPSVTLNTANEPLIAKVFPQAVRRLKEKGIVGTFNTNGLMLTEKLAQLLVEIKFDSINFSVDATTPETLKKIRGVSCLDKLVRNIEMMVAVRGKNLLPRIGVTFVDQPDNHHEFAAFLDFWKTRVDVIRVSSFIKPGAPDISDTCTPMFDYKGVKRTCCIQPFRDIVIRPNGDVSPCVIPSEDPTIVAGNVFKDGGVKAVFHGAEMEKLRALHTAGRWDDVSFCRTCDYWLDSLPIKEERRDGFLIRYSSPYTVFYNVIERMNNWESRLFDRTGPSKNKP